MHTMQHDDNDHNDNRDAGIGSSIFISFVFDKSAILIVYTTVASYRDATVIAFVNDVDGRPSL